MLDVARFHNMEYIYLTCDEDNVASYGSIEKLGAEIMEICNAPREYFGWHEGMTKQRFYKLDLNIYDVHKLI